MYIKLKENNFILEQPTGHFFSYFINGERMLLEVNDTALDILLCLDGKFKLKDIIYYLVDKYDESYAIVKEIVQEFLSDLSENNLLNYCKENKKINILKGSTEIYTPDFVTFDLTHNCPLKCEHCFINAGIGKSMSPEFSVSLLKELIELGVTTFQLTGGEPFSYPYLKNLIKIMVDNQVSIRIATSGYILNRNAKECLEILSKYEDVHIQVSVDGLEETHNRIRGKKDSFEKAMNFIDFCINYKLPVIIATSLIDQTIQELKELTNLLKNKYILQQRLGLISDQGRAKENTINRYNYNEFMNTISILKSLYETENFSIEEIENKDIDTVDCGAGYKTIKISPIGLVTPCAMMSFNIGNLNVESLKTVLTRTTKNFMKLSSPNKNFCSGCFHEDYCNGCISEALIRKNSVDYCDWYDSQKTIISECKVVVI